MRNCQKDEGYPEHISGDFIMPKALFRASICITCGGRMRVIGKEFASRWSKLVTKQCIKCSREFSCIERSSQ